MPEDDKGLMTRSEMIARLVFAMGGRAAEELVFREPTTGAVSDIEQATKIARAMVTEYGMSSKLGAVRYGTEHGDPFLGRTMGTQADYSHEVAQIIDDEVRKLIEAAHTEAWEILTEYRDVLDILAGELLEKETLHRAELQAIFGDVKKRPRLTMFDDFGGRVPSDKPPIKTPGELAIERGEPWPQAGAGARLQGRHRAGQQGPRRPPRSPRPARTARTVNGANGDRNGRADAARLRRARRLARSRAGRRSRSSSQQPAAPAAVTGIRRRQPSGGNPAAALPAVSALPAARPTRRRAANRTRTMSRGQENGRQNPHG